MSSLGKRLMQIHFHSVLAIFVLLLLAVLLWFGKVSAEVFTGIAGVVVGYYFGAKAAVAVTGGG